MAASDRVLKLARRYEQLVAQRAPYEAIWREIATYIVPRKSAPLVIQTPGASQTVELYDSTAPHALELLASSMQGSLTSPATRWFRLRMRLDALNASHDVQMWLEECTNRIYRALNQSNFSAEIIEVYTDLGGFGTGALLLLEATPEYPTAAFGGFLFVSLPIGSYVISEGADGSVNTLMRKIVMPAHAVLERWPGAKETSEYLAHAETRNPDEPIEIIHAIYPRAADPDAPVDRLGKRWVSLYWMERDKTLLHEDGFYDFPALVPRWTKTHGEIYGRGPGHTALPDVKTLNKAVELNLKAWDKEIDPPLLVRNDGVFGPVRLIPSGITLVSDPERDVKPLLSNARHDVTAIQVEALRSSIKDIFYNNQLQLPGPNPQYMTATEVELRYQLMQRILGPTLGRLESELLGPLVKRAFLMMLRDGALPRPPDLVVQAIRAGLSEVDIEWEGALPRAQRFADVQAVQRAMAVLAPIAQAKPEVLDNFDFDRVARRVAMGTGVPAEVLRDARAVQEMREARADMQAKQMLLQQQLAGSQALVQSTQAAANAATAAEKTGLLEGAAA
jgi:hypothetical protein